MPEAAKGRKNEKSDEKYESKFAKYKSEPQGLSSFFRLRWNGISGYTRKEKHGFTKKLSAEEKAARLAAVQGNAAAHDVARKARVTKGREEDEKEEQAIKKDDHSYFRYVFDLFQ